MDYTNSSDFRRLWIARSAAGATSAIAMGAIPLIAVKELDASTLMLSMLTAISGIFGALFSFLLGPMVEGWRKRPFMIMSDVVRAIFLLSIPLAVSIGYLSFIQLLIVTACTSFLRILFSGVSAAHLKDLVPPEDRTRAIGKMHSTRWLFSTIGPAIGGVIIQLLGVTATLSLQVMGLFLSAAGVMRIKNRSLCPRKFTIHIFLKMP